MHGEVERATATPWAVEAARATGLQAQVVAAASAFPRHHGAQKDLAEAIVSRWSHLPAARQARAKRFHLSSGVDFRYHALPAQDWQALRGFGARGKVWFEVGLQLAEQALAQALERAHWAPQSLDALYFVSITGVSAPSMDAWLVGRLGLNRFIKRVPIFGLGCGGGAMGLARVADFLKAYPRGRAALVSVELCSLTFQAQDASPANMIASGLFGDGAAAVLLEGGQAGRGRASVPDGANARQAALSAPEPAAVSRSAAAASPPMESPLPVASLSISATTPPPPTCSPNAERPDTGRTQTGRPTVLATRSVLFENTPHLMGWAVVDEGFQIELSPELPKLVREHLGAETDAFLADQDLSRNDIAAYLAHTGGPKVLDAVAAALDLPPAALERSRANLRAYGNLSSAAVLVILEDFMTREVPPPGSYALLFAMGPGFALELVLLRW